MERPCGYPGCKKRGEIMRHAFEGGRDEFVCETHYFQAVPVKTEK